MATGWSGWSSSARRSRRLVPGVGALVGQQVGLGPGRGQAVDEGLHHGLGLGADELVDHRAVPDGEHGRDRLDPEAGRRRVGLSSTLTLTSSTAPSVAATACSRMGPSVVHGPHQGAHRSTTTGTSAERVRTTSSKVASVTSTMATDDTGPATARPVRRPGAADRCPAARVASGHGRRTDRHAPTAAADEPPSRGSTRPGDRLAGRQRGRRRAALHLRAHRRRALQPDLPGDRRRRARLRPAPAPGQPRPRHRPRHGPRAHGDQRPAADRRARAPDARPVHRHRGQRRPLLRDVLRRGPHPPRRAAVGRSCPRRSGPTPATSLVDTLAALHAVDVDAVGLGDFARREGYIARQLKRWHGQFEQSTLDGRPGPGRHRPGLGGAVGQDPRAAGRGHRPRRLPARQHRARRRRRRRRHPRLGDLHPRRPAGRPGPPAASTGPRPATPDPAVLGVAPDGTARLRHPRPAASSATPRPAGATCPPSPTTGPSASGSWPASSRASTSATPGARRPATAAGSTSSPTGVARLGERALADVEAL